MDNVGKVIVGVFSFSVIVLFIYLGTNIKPTQKKCIEDRVYVLKNGYWRGTYFDCKPFMGESDE